MGQYCWPRRLLSWIILRREYGLAATSIEDRLKSYGIACFEILARAQQLSALLVNERPSATRVAKRAALGMQFSELCRRYANHLMEMAGQVTLIHKPGGESHLNKGEFSLS
jgi:hypothetical protein